MPKLIDKLCQFSYRLGEKYRLAGQPIFTETELTFRLLGHIANSYNKVAPLHDEQMKLEIESFRLSESQIKQAVKAYVAGQQMVTDLFEASLRFFSSKRVTQEMLLQCCWRMIWADRHLGVREYQLVHLWGYWLGWSRPNIEELGVAYRPVYISHEHQHALTLLGITSDTSPEKIKKMYKKQLSIHHPDKIIGAGGTPAEISEATEKTNKLHEAYTLIRMLHNF